MKYRFIAETKGDLPVKTCCDLLGVSRAGFYA